MRTQKQEHKNRVLELLKHSFGKDIMRFMEDGNVIEIMLNPDKKLWVDTLKEGMLDTGILIEHATAMIIINTVANHCKTIVDVTNSTISAELPESGFRFEGIIPPNVDNASFTIRKKATLIFSLDDYIKMECLTIEQANYIKTSIKEHKNILVVGGTSTGKTTFTNACIAEISKTDRLLILEDTKELQSVCPNTVFLKTSDYKTMADLLKSTMRYRPDRIIVGEVRGGEALDLLTAWNSGHPGGFSTVHSNSDEGGLKQLEQYIQRVSINKQQELIAMAVNVIIVLRRIGNKRKVTSISEVKGFEDNKYILEKIC